MINERLWLLFDAAFRPVLGARAPIRASFNHVALDLNNFYTQKSQSKQRQPPKALI